MIKIHGQHDQGTIDQLSRCVMVKLLPCPFCGGKAEIEQYGTSRRSSIVACTNCGCRLEANETTEQTGMMWNLRYGVNETGRMNPELTDGNYEWVCHGCGDIWCPPRDVVPEDVRCPGCDTPLSKEPAVSPQPK